MLAAITIGPHRQLANWINEMCAQMGDICVYKTLHQYPDPHGLAQLVSIFTPELLFLDIDSSETALTLVRETRACHPKTAVIGFVQRYEEEPVRQAAAAGVAEVLPAPCTPEEFQQAVLRAVAAQRSGTIDNVIAFLPAKAGSGATTTVLHVAASLAQDWNQNVLVLEADLASGALAHLLGLEPENSILDALENSRWINDGMWSRLPSSVHGFDLLPMPTARSEAALSRWEYQRLLTFVRSRYDAVIVDLPEFIDDGSEGILTQARSVYVVCTPERPSLFLARRRIDELQAHQVPETRIQIVLNRNWEPEADFLETERLLERRMSVVLPNEEACLRRKVPETPLVDRESELGRAFASFARMLAGIAPPPPPPEPKSGLRSLFRHLVLEHHP